ncbi:transposase (plasmid) [Streptomyces scopuliridis]|uniref:transposase n=1 Tax=Streptomyces scopuliridis TaxID=452529 RepID=UPI002DDA9153|nr:transposase [Streptomyces scopuliridis]WSB39061.1 transposase [Streptomyces scopuliridis]
MARPSKYSPEFRSDALALWRASAGRRTFKDVAVDLNVNPETLRTWVRDADGSPAVDSASQGMEGELARAAGGERPAAEEREGMAAGAGDPPPGGCLFRPGDEVKTAAWDFVSAHAGMYGIKRICRVRVCPANGVTQVV